MRTNPEKCQFFTQEVLYVGHRVTSQGIGTGRTTLNSPRAEAVLWSGFMVRRFVPDVVKPLKDLLRKGVK